MQPNLLLIGPRASGKTTIGRRLAAELQWHFVDLDEVVLESFAEQTVNDVWATHGETAWREGEIIALRQALSTRGQVIAPGGGVPCLEEAKLLLEAAREAGDAIVIYLEAAAEVLVSRLGASSGDRPSLTGQGTVAEVPRILEERTPIYRSLADLTIDTGRMSPDEACQRIASHLRDRAD